MEGETKRESGADNDPSTDACGVDNLAIAANAADAATAAAAALEAEVWAGGVTSMDEPPSSQRGGDSTAPETVTYCCCW